MIESQPVRVGSLRETQLWTRSRSRQLARYEYPKSHRPCVLRICSSSLSCTTTSPPVCSDGSAITRVANIPGAFSVLHLVGESAGEKAGRIFPVSVEKCTWLIQQQPVQLGTDCGSAIKTACPLATFFTTSCTVNGQAGLRSSNWLEFSSQVLRTVGSTNVSLPLPKGASWLTRLKPSASRLESGSPTFQIPCTDKPGFRAFVTGQDAAKLPLFLT